MKRNSRKHRRGALAATVATVLILATAACSSDGGAKPTSSAGDLDAALQKETTLDFWGWVPNIEKTIALFEKEYPKITVNYQNTGVADATYTKLRTVLKSGKGVPDVVQVGYGLTSSFAITKDLVNLSDYGVDSLKDQFYPAAWSSVTFQGDAYSVPMDFGPRVMFYREDIFNRLGITPPTTWDEFAKVAQVIHDDNPSNYATWLDPGNAGETEQYLWAAGSRPFDTNGSTVKVNLQDEGAKKWADAFTPLLQNDLLDVANQYTEPWYNGLASGKYAIWFEGAWAPTYLSSTIPQTAGLWKAALVPQWNAGDAINSQDASGTAVTAQSDSKEAAVAFAKWLGTNSDAVKSLNENSLQFPAQAAIAEDQQFLETPNEFLGGQKANAVFVEAAKQVAPGWQWLPYESYADTVFADTAGQVIAEHGDLNEALQKWQEVIVQYGESQGFTVETK